MKPFRSLLIAILLPAWCFSQPCNCANEFTNIKNFIEKNYAGFRDKQVAMTKARYDKMVAEFSAYSQRKDADETCLLLISNYLSSFKDHHIQISNNFGNTQPDSTSISRRKIIPIADNQLKRLQQSTDGYEGIYNFKFDSSYRIAVVKRKDLPYDYVGVIVSSRLPTWKPGMIKFAARQVEDSLLKGVLYIRNHLPKVEWFALGKNTIGGDWQREETKPEPYPNEPYVPVASRKLTPKTLYIKISSFSPANFKQIDSVFKVNKTTLDTMPYLVLDVRNNGGGSDFAYSPISPYIYTNPVKTIGVDVLATEANINGWKVLLEDKDIPEESKQSISRKIQLMEKNKGRLVPITGDEMDSSLTVSAFPRKVVVLINGGCASTTEQFLLEARQSTKVILMGEHTSGTLDYSNMRDRNFSCYPYQLNYATTRSRRLDAGQGIDNAGIQPNIKLTPTTDWVQEAVKLLER